MKIECSKYNLPEIAVLTDRLNQEGHIVLFLSDADSNEAMRIVNTLSPHFPDYSLFLSGFCQISLVRVISRLTVFQHEPMFRIVIDDFIALSKQLADSYRKNDLSNEWNIFEHGEHCLLVNNITGLEVEILIDADWTYRNLDPYFLSRYIKTCSGNETLKQLIKHDYHDVRRVLDLLFKR